MPALTELGRGGTAPWWPLAVTATVFVLGTLGFRPRELR